MGKFTITGTAKARGVDKVNKDLMDTAKRAAAKSPYDVEVFSGPRPGAKGQHGKNNAIDVVLKDPKTGKEIPNIGSRNGADIYEGFARQMKDAQVKYHPTMPIRWGGGFSPSFLNPKGFDLMHFDTRKDQAMAYYDWDSGWNEKGLAALQKLGPGMIYSDKGQFAAPANTQYANLWTNSEFARSQTPGSPTPPGSIPEAGSFRDASAAVLKKNPKVVDNRVKFLQQTLNEQFGFNLKVDGKFGDGTEKALKQFQTAARIPADGAAGPLTFGMVGALSNKPLPPGTKGVLPSHMDFSRAAIASPAGPGGRLSDEFSRPAGGLEQYAEASRNTRTPEMLTSPDARNVPPGAGPGGTPTAGYDLDPEVIRRARTRAIYQKIMGPSGPAEGVFGDLDYKTDGRRMSANIEDRRKIYSEPKSGFQPYDPTSGISPTELPPGAPSPEGAARILAGNRVATPPRSRTPEMLTSPDARNVPAGASREFNKDDFSPSLVAPDMRPADIQESFNRRVSPEVRSANLPTQFDRPGRLSAEFAAAAPADGLETYARQDMRPATQRVGPAVADTLRANAAQAARDELGRPEAYVRPPANPNRPRALTPAEAARFEKNPVFDSVANAPPGAPPGAPKTPRRNLAMTAPQAGSAPLAAASGNTTESPFDAFTRGWSGEGGLMQYSQEAGPAREVEIGMGTGSRPGAMGVGSANLDFNAPIARERPDQLATAGDFIRGGGFIRSGTQGQHVREIQNFLNTRGYTDDAGNALKLDSRMGDRTAQALQRYQRDNPGLKVDSIVGNYTLSQMRRDTGDLSGGGLGGQTGRGPGSIAPTAPSRGGVDTRPPSQRVGPPPRSGSGGISTSAPVDTRPASQRVGPPPKRDSGNVSGAKTSAPAGRASASVSKVSSTKGTSSFGSSGGPQSAARKTATKSDPAASNKNSFGGPR